MITYLRDEYVNNYKNSFFKCSIHGEFRLQYNRAIKDKVTCKKCKIEDIQVQRRNKEIELIKELGPAIHNNKFDYTDIKFDKATNKYKIKCLKHGYIFITYSNHIKRKQQCKKCSLENKTILSKKLIERSLKFGFKIVKKESCGIITIECNKHGIITAYQNTLTNGCPRCASEKLKIEMYNNIKNDLNSNIKDLNKLKVVNVSKGALITLHCNKHNTVNVSASNFRRTYNCPKCANRRKSRAEEELGDLVPDSILNTKKIIKPLELDVYSKENNFAIEYDGLMWHSFGKSKSQKFNNAEFEVFSKASHLLKTIKCEEKSIQLYHIFEDEWLDLNKRLIWKSVINSKLGRTERIYARKCTIKEVSSKISSTFLEQNHLQGKINASIRLGLYYQDELVQIMTFRKPTQNKYKGERNYELSRLCSKLNTTVTGGGSKLLTYFERNYNPKSIISYANRRWSVNTESNVYIRLGFAFKNKTPPNYFYFGKDKKLMSRNVFQKHKLRDKLDSFNPELTETENMYNNNYRKIYDSGNLVFIKEY